MPKKPNVIFILMDALRAKNLHCYGYERKTSPNIDLLALEGTRFTNAFSSNNATEKSFLAILSGRHVLLDHSKKQLLLSGEELNSFFNSGGVFIQELLKKEGYKTYCLNELYGWQQKGFDFFYKQGEILRENRKGFLQKVKGRLRGLGREIVHIFPSRTISNKIKSRYGRDTGERATQDAIKIIKESSKKKENFFLYVYYNDTHIPYNPKNFADKFETNSKKESFIKSVIGKGYNPMLINFWRGAFHKKDSTEDIIARYDEAIAYDDLLIEKIINSLKEEGLFENTIIVFFSDHGESLTEHEIYFDHHGLYDVTTNFPLIIVGKGFDKNTTKDKFVQHEDFAPTVLDACGIQYDKNLFDGKSIFFDEERKFVFMEEGDKENKKAVRTKKYKYIEDVSGGKAKCSYCNRMHGDTQELYDLENDPNEEKNIFDKQKEIAIKLKETMDNYTKDLKLKNESRKIKNLFRKKVR